VSWSALGLFLSRKGGLFRLSCASHDSDILAAAHKSGGDDIGMLGFSAVAVAVAVAVEFGVDGMLRFATLAQEVIV